jgi:hypothetical protein
MNYFPIIPMGAVSSQLSSGFMVGITESGDVEQTSKLLVALMDQKSTIN